MSATPQLLISAAGLAAANKASPTGPFISIVSFSIGDGFGYTPQVTDTGLNGALLYSGIPTSYSYAGDGTMDIMCVIPADAGPFNFGEVALYLPGGVMFAKAVFDTQQTKYSSLGTNISSTYTFNCLLKLSQGPAIISVTTNNGIPPAVWEVSHWSDVYPPNLSANPAIPMIIVQDLSPVLADATLLVQASSTQWTISNNYDFLQTAIVVNSTLTTVDAAATSFSLGTLNYTTGQLVLRFADGYMRSVNSVTASGSNYRFTLNPQPLLNPQVANSVFDLFLVSSDTALYVQNGTGAGQNPNIVKIGINANSKLLLSVDSTNYANNWPISVTGSAASTPVTSTIGNGGDITQPMTFGFQTFANQPLYLWGGNTVGAAQGLVQPSNLKVAYATNAASATNATNATNASYATSANSATYSTNAGNASTANFASVSDSCNSSLGNNQSWNNYTGSRAIGVSYTNTTGRSIVVSVQIDSSSGGNIYSTLYVNGIPVAAYNYQNRNYNNASCLTAVVPNGFTYQCNVAGSNPVIPLWSELR